MPRFMYFLATLLLIVACSGPPGARVPPGSEVIAFGDSVTAGVGALPGEDYPSLLRAATGWNVVNAGLSGDTAAAAGPRLAKTLEGRQPRLIIIEIGGNDFLRRTPPAQVKEDVRGLIQQARATGAQVVLVGVPSLSIFGIAARALQDAEFYADLADEEQVVLIEDVLSEVLSDAQLRADAVHPNARGYQQLSEGMLEALREQGLYRPAP